MIFVLFIILSISAPLCGAQNWWTQRHYLSSSCAGAPYLEASADGGAQACSAASPCLPSLGDPDYVFTECVGNGPSISIKGASGQQFTDTSCSTLVSVSAYVTDTCISLGSESFKIVCTDSGIVQMDFSDTQCASSSSNTTVESGAPNTCIPSQFGSGSSSRYSCVASALSHSLIASLLLLLVLCWFF